MNPNMENIGTLQEGRFWEVKEVPNPEDDVPFILVGVAMAGLARTCSVPLFGILGFRVQGLGHFGIFGLPLCFLSASILL